MNGTPGPRSPRREATRRRVLDAARDVFAERGVIGGTVEEICAAAGFTRGAFYSNFPDKLTVVRELLIREEEQLLALLDDSFELPKPAPDGTIADPATVIGWVADRLLATIPADREFLLIRTEMEISAIRDPDIAAEFRHSDARFRSRVQAFVERGLEQLGLELTLDPADATDAMICIVERSTRRALLEGPGADPNALARVTLPPFLVAISRRRGETAPAAPRTRVGRFG